MAKIGSGQAVEAVRDRRSSCGKSSRQKGEAEQDELVSKLVQGNLILRFRPHPQAAIERKTYCIEELHSQQMSVGPLELMAPRIPSSDHVMIQNFMGCHHSSVVDDFTSHNHM